MKTPEERFHSKYVKCESGCWEWIGKCMHAGYGEFYVKGNSTVRAHRFSYIIHKGQIEHGALVCHTCDNRKCVNPDHLWLGSAKDNAMDASAKGRLQGQSKSTYPNSQRGAKNNRAMLSEVSVLQIREMYAAGEKMSDLAKLFGCSYKNIVAIVTRRSWSHCHGA